MCPILPKKSFVANWPKWIMYTAQIFVISCIRFVYLSEFEFLMISSKCPISDAIVPKSSHCFQFQNRINSYQLKMISFFEIFSWCLKIFKRLKFIRFATTRIGGIPILHRTNEKIAFWADEVKKKEEENEITRKMKSFVEADWIRFLNVSACCKKNSYQYSY